MKGLKRLEGSIATAAWLAAVVVGIALVAPAVGAQTKWQERTVLRFDRPVMVPGKTLQPGTYVFRLADSKSDRNLMQIYTADPDNPVHENRLVATTMTVPMRREQPNGDIVLKFSETSADANSPVALKGFFYPGTLYGHQFVYTDQQAQDIAKQTHTLVLSRDVAGSDLDMQRGTLHNIDANGNRSAWQENPDVAKEWAAWVVTWEPTHNGNANGVNATATTNRPSSGENTVGTTGRTATTASADNAAMTPQDHAQAIEQLVDRALNGSSSTVTIDRATLQQIRSHAEAIEHGGGQMHHDKNRK